MKFLRFLLFPFAIIYDVVTTIRNFFFNVGVFKQTSFKTPIIVVGNLSVGGTGKTPMIEYLITLLKDNFKIATLSRGYKRETSGFQLADENASATSIGDEPFQFYNKFKDDILVTVDSDRRNGIENLQKHSNVPDIILLDDAFQHRSVKAGFNILLTTYSNPYFKDIVLPTGNLREPRNGAKRAHVIIVTKCPTKLSDNEKNQIVKQISPKDYQHVFFSTIAYSNEVISVKATLKID